MRVTKARPVPQPNKLQMLPPERTTNNEQRSRSYTDRMDDVLAPPISTRPNYPAPSFRDRALDLIFPPTCVMCRRIGRWICESCWATIAWTHDRRCMSCHRPWPVEACPQCSEAATPLDSVTAVAEFDGVAREAVHALKYYGRHAISSVMSRTMAGAATGFPIDRVAPIPLHRSRRRERGYDQAALLARGVAVGVDLRFEPSTLERVRRTRQQTTLGADARRRNVAGAFEVRDNVDGETILLVDDVYTTGATMESAAATLQAAGAERILGLTFACAVFGRDAFDQGPESGQA